MSNKQTQMYTARQLACACRVTTGTIYRWAKEGKLNAVWGLAPRNGVKEGWVFPEAQFHRALSMSKDVTRTERLIAAFINHPNPPTVIRFLTGEHVSLADSIKELLSCKRDHQ